MFPDNRQLGLLGCAQCAKGDLTYFMPNYEEPQRDHPVRKDETDEEWDAYISEWQRQDGERLKASLSLIHKV